MEENPYQSPHEAEPLKKAKAVKRAIGVGTILLLTPLAVLIAFGASCLATMASMESSILGNTLESAIVRGLIIFFVPPVLVLVAMIWWAVWASRRARNERDLKHQQLLRDVH